MNCRNASLEDVYPKSSAAMMKNPMAKPEKMRMATRSILTKLQEAHLMSDQAQSMSDEVRWEGWACWDLSQVENSCSKCNCCVLAVE